MRMGAWQFKPRLLPSLVTLFVFPALLALGFWQLDRAEQKRTQYADSIRFRDQPPLLLNRLNRERLQEADMLWRPVEVYGEMDAGHTLFLDNQVYKGETGYFVLVPFLLDGTTSAVLVNRGWVGAGNDRRQIPAIETPTGKITLTGTTKDVPSTGIFLGDKAIEKLGDGIYRIQRVSIDEIAQMLGYDLLPYIIRLEPESRHGFSREWPQAGSGEEKHLGYAFQWFALAATLLVIYIVVNCRKTETD